MPSRIRHVTIDCHQPYPLARFWAAVLGFVDDPEDPNHPDDPEAALVDPTGRHPGLLFLPVPEAKDLKNRVHLDLVPDVDRDLAVEEILGLGATLLADHRRPDGTGFAVLADPEGNEFCVERSAAQRGDPRPVDTGRRAMPPLHARGEAEMLPAMLDWYREGVLAKVAGVSPFDAVRSPLRSGTTIAGLVKHLALVEDSWFTDDLAGLPLPDIWATVDWEADPDWEFRTASEEPIEELVTLYQEACDRSRRAVAGRGLDEIGADTSRREFSLRFVYLHMIEETARHLGHLDALREFLDGTTGE